jgi:SAM-dependent methyltransferase
VRARVFGRDPAAYDRARLPYPRQVYEILTTRCGLRAGARVFEVGPGTGIATRELLRRGADPLTLVEPDRRLATWLRASLEPNGARIRFAVTPFERATLPRGGFDLGVAASSFHWTSERRALRKVARLLRPGGWWASWNNYHGDPYRSSPFNRALQPLYRELSGGRKVEQRPRSVEAKERRRRLAALRAVEAFGRISRDDLHWSVTLGTERIVALWGTFSDIIVRHATERRRFLLGLRTIVDEQFGGKVRIAMLTAIYTAQRI